MRPGRLIARHSFLIIAIFALVLVALPRSAPAAFTLVKPPNNLGLVGYWSFNEGTGTIATDFAGRGNNGQLLGSPSWTSGKFGKALSFNGTTDYVAVPATTDLSAFGTGDFIISFWLKPRAFEALDSYINTWSLSANTGDWRVYLSGTFPVLQIFDAGACNELLVSGTSLQLNAWQHLVMTRVSGTLTMYLNGVQVDQVASNCDLTVAHQDLHFGRMFVTTDEYFDGVIDEARVYKGRGLSAAQVYTLYKSSGHAKLAASTADLHKGSTLENGLVGHWTFDGADVTTTVTDRSGQGNDGYFIGSATSSAKVIGKLGQALNFDGSDHHIRVDAVANDVQSGSATMSLWFKLASRFDINSTADQLLFTVSTAASTNDLGLRLEESNGAFQFATFSTIVDFINSTVTSWEANAWYHVVGVIDTDVGGGQRLYVNGILDNSSSVTSRGSTFATQANIGNTWSGSPFQGVLDDVRIYNRALSANEVNQLYHLGQVKIVR